MNESNSKGESVNPSSSQNQIKYPLDILDLSETSRPMMDNMNKVFEQGLMPDNER